jgi:hypothetical protein
VSTKTTFRGRKKSPLEEAQQEVCQVEGKRQDAKARGRRQKAEGKRQRQKAKGKGRRQKAEGRRQKRPVALCLLTIALRLDALLLLV